MAEFCSFEELHGSRSDEVSSKAPEHPRIAYFDAFGSARADGNLFCLSRFLYICEAIVKFESGNNVVNNFADCRKHCIVQTTACFGQGKQRQDILQFKDAALLRRHLTPPE